MAGSDRRGSRRRCQGSGRRARPRSGRTPQGHRSVTPIPTRARTKADVIYLDLENAIDDHLVAVGRRLAEGHDLAGALAEATAETLNLFIADEYNRARVLRSLKSPNFDTPRALWTWRWNDRLAELLRAHLPEGPDRDLQARAAASVCLYTAWAAVEQWAAQGLDEPLEPILRKAFGLAATAARDGEVALQP